MLFSSLTTEDTQLHWRDSYLSRMVPKRRRPKVSDMVEEGRMTTASRLFLRFQLGSDSPRL